MATRFEEFLEMEGQYTQQFARFLDLFEKNGAAYRAILEGGGGASGPAARANENACLPCSRGAPDSPLAQTTAAGTRQSATAAGTTQSATAVETGNAPLLVSDEKSLMLDRAEEIREMADATLNYSEALRYLSKLMDGSATFADHLAHSMRNVTAVFEDKDFRKNTAAKALGGLEKAFHHLGKTGEWSGKVLKAAMAEMTASILQEISKRAVVEAVEQMALGFGAYPDFTGMTNHFAAAALFASLAGGLAMAGGYVSGKGAKIAEEVGDNEDATGSGGVSADSSAVSWSDADYRDREMRLLIVRLDRISEQLDEGNAERRTGNSRLARFAQTTAMFTSDEVLSERVYDVTRRRLTEARLYGG